MVATPRVGLVASDPADGAVVAAAPAAVGLAFSGPVRLTAFVLTNAIGFRVETGFSIGLVPACEHSVPLPPLAPGEYSVLWRARPADRRPISGTLAFTVGAADA